MFRSQLNQSWVKSAISSATASIVMKQVSAAIHIPDIINCIPVSSNVCSTYKTVTFKKIKNKQQSAETCPRVYSNCNNWLFYILKKKLRIRHFCTDVLCDLFFFHYNIVKNVYVYLIRLEAQYILWVLN